MSHDLQTSMYRITAVYVDGVVTDPDDASFAGAFPPQITYDAQPEDPLGGSPVTIVEDMAPTNRRPAPDKFKIMPARIDDLCFVCLGPSGLLLDVSEGVYATPCQVPAP